MPLPRTPELKQELVYIDGQDEPVLMTVDTTTAPGGSWADRRHDRMKDARTKRAALERAERKQLGDVVAEQLKAKRAKMKKKLKHRR